MSIYIPESLQKTGFWRDSGQLNGYFYTLKSERLDKNESLEIN